MFLFFKRTPVVTDLDLIQQVLIKDIHPSMIFEEPRHSALFQNFIVTNSKLAKKLRMKILRDDLTDFFLSAVKNTVDYRLKNCIERNDFMDQLIELRMEFI
ncbi:GD10574 [Drosophila simulans]|uniref:GD10574 n=1 Tax=Drosophila simulans TaxID=7240 RepID=B4QFU0_DROSI|nr:GD10574 [Drosophila simulans]